MHTKHDPKKEAGVRFKRTPQRLAILDYLDGNTSHPSAEDVYRMVSKKYRSMSLATVYNTLNAFSKAGSLRELTIDPSRKRYDPDTSDHNHFLCVLCGRIEDIPAVTPVSVPDDLGRGLTVLGSHTEYYGHCASCNKKKKSS